MSSPSRPSFPLIPRIQVRVPGADVMTGLVLMMLGIHFLLDRMGGSMEIPQVYRLLGLSWECVAQGGIWQIFTHALLHASWVHLVLNLVLLWLLSGRLIHVLGHRVCLKILTVGVLSGGFLHLLTGVIMQQAGSPESHLIGISGGCMALLLALTTLSPDSRMWPIPVSGKHLGLGLILGESILWLMHPGMGLPVFSKMGEHLVLRGGAGVFHISHACHLGGALAGWWMARRVLAPPPSLEKLQHLREDQESAERTMDGAK